jgi:hypothetical protein
MYNLHTMSYAYKNPTPEQIERRRAKWRAYYYRHREKHLERARQYKAGLEGERLESYRSRMREYLKQWHKDHPDYHKSPERRAYAREWKRRERERDPEGVKRRAKGQLLKRKYGISLAEYEAMLTAQADACAICSKPETLEIHGSLVYLAVDHDHVTGKIRGLLCSRCNQGIGSLHDDPERLRRAIAYLT